MRCDETPPHWLAAGGGKCAAGRQECAVAGSHRPPLLEQAARYGAEVFSEDEDTKHEGAPLGGVQRARRRRHSAVSGAVPECRLRPTRGSAIDAGRAAGAGGARRQHRLEGGAQSHARWRRGSRRYDHRRGDLCRRSAAAFREHADRMQARENVMMLRRRVVRRESGAGVRRTAPQLGARAQARFWAYKFAARAEGCGSSPHNTRKKKIRHACFPAGRVVAARRRLERSAAPAAVVGELRP